MATSRQLPLQNQQLLHRRQSLPRKQAIPKLLHPLKLAKSTSAPTALALGKTATPARARNLETAARRVTIAPRHLAFAVGDVNPSLVLVMRAVTRSVQMVHVAVIKAIRVRDLRLGHAVHSTGTVARQPITVVEGARRRMALVVDY